MSSFLPIIMWWVPRVPSTWSQVDTPLQRLWAVDADGDWMQLIAKEATAEAAEDWSEDHDVLHIFQVWLKLRKHHAIYCNIISSLLYLYILDICRLKKTSRTSGNNRIDSIHSRGLPFSVHGRRWLAPAARHNFSRRTLLERRHPFRPSHRSRRNEKWRWVNKEFCVLSTSNRIWLSHGFWGMNHNDSLGVSPKIGDPQSKNMALKMFQATKSTPNHGHPIIRLDDLGRYRWCFASVPWPSRIVHDSMMPI